MNALICMLHSKYIHSALAPWYLLAGIKKFGDPALKAEVVEGTVNMDIEAAAERIISQNPQAVGFCCYIWNISFIKKLLPVMKKALPDAVIILGGPEVSYNAGEVLKTMPHVDYVISGEGEKPFALLLNALCSGNDAGEIPGVCYQSGGVVSVQQPYDTADIPPDPYCEDYFKALDGRIAYLETSRGCPFQCAFCLSGADTCVRFFPIERAKSHLVLLANSGTQTIKLVDRTFNADRRRARELFSFIIEKHGTLIPEGVCFHFEIGGDLLDDDTLALLKSAPPGLIQFEIGLQSFHAETLEALNRKTNIDRLKRNIKQLLSFGNIHIHVDLIAGLPYEDLRLFADSFNTAYALGPHMLQLGFLKLLHGSEMRDYPEKYPCRYAGEPPYTVTSTRWLTSDELDLLSDTEEVLDRLYNSGRFKRTLVYVLQQSLKTPFELYRDAGVVLAGELRNGISLDGLTGLMLDYFSTFKSVDKMVLRDSMVCDRLATNASGKLPASLRIFDKRLKSAALAIEQAEGAQQTVKAGPGYAILYTEQTVVRADYTQKDPVAGEYPLKRYPLL